MAILYRHRRLDTNEIFYIGIGKEEKRAFNKKDRSNFWKSIINKTDYSIEIIADDLSWEDAKELEIFLISLYGRRNLGTGTLVNMTDGGDGTLGSISQIGDKNGFYGKTHSNETKEKLSIAHTGKIISNKTKNKMSNSQKNNNNAKTRLVLNIETGIFYNTCVEAAIAHNIKYSYLSPMLTGSFKNKTNLIYV